MKNFCLMAFLLCTGCSVLATTSTGVSLTRGFSGVDGMNGFSLGMQKYWGSITTIGTHFELTGLWNFDLAYWTTKDSKNSDYSNLTIASLSPILRLQRFAFENGVSPFVDVGYGLGLMNRDQFSDQKLGTYATFVFSAGLGINFGKQAQYDLSYHYLNFNNANQLKDDDGLYANTVTFTYRFGGADQS